MPPRPRARLCSQPESSRARHSHSCTKSCTGHAELCSRATPGSLFSFTVLANIRVQVRKHGNLLLITPSHKHPSSHEIFQPLTTGRDEQIGTKSKGLFSMWANPFKHLHSPSIKQLIWPKKKNHLRCVKQGDDFCISLQLQLFLIYDIITHQGHQPAGSLRDPPASVLQACQRASCATHYSAFFCSSLRKNEDKKLTVYFHPIKVSCSTGWAEQGTANWLIMPC